MPAAAIRSAESMAALRALATSDCSLATPCSDTFAHRFLGTRNRILLRLAPHSAVRALMQLLAPGGYAYAVARTRHIDETLLRAVRTGIEQIVILGAGYDSRALRFETELAGIRVFELDHPGTQARKTRLLEKARYENRARSEFISVDFANQSFGDRLAAHSFRQDRKTLFLWEGVSYYLPETAVRDVLNFVAGCARGSSIVFDYALESFVRGDTSTYGGKQISSWLKRIGEPFLFGMTAVEAPGFLARHNLAVGLHLGPEDLAALYLTRRDQRPPSRTLGHVRIIEGFATARS